MLFMSRFFVLFSSICILYLSCDKPSKPIKNKESKPNKIQQNKNQHVINELRNMISGADPLKNYHMNYQRSTYYYQQSKLTSNSIADRKENTMYYIWELLYAGNTDKCIQELEFLLKELIISFSKFLKSKRMTSQS